MQALIIRDIYDDPEAYLELLSILKGFNIYEIPSISKFDEIKNKLNPCIPCLFFNNVYIRYENILGIYKNHLKDPSLILLEFQRQLISFLPEKCYLKFNRIISTDSPVFRLKNVNISFFKKKIDPPTIFMVAGGRVDYFNLTLNSLLHNITEPVYIKIALNGPMPKVLDIIKNKNNKNIEVIQIEENSVLSAFNILYQIFKPKKFIILEDDFIIPPTFNDYYPNWAYQFINRLDFVDTVATGPELENSPYNWGLERDTFENTIEGDWDYFYSNNRKYLIGNMFSIKSDFFIYIIKKYMNLNNSNNTKKYLTPTDKEVLAESRLICSPKLKGYHIGWNEKMDGLYKINKYQPVKEAYNAISLTTGHEYSIKLRDIIL